MDVTISHVLALCSSISFIPLELLAADNNIPLGNNFPLSFSFETQPKKGAFSFRKRLLPLEDFDPNFEQLIIPDNHEQVFGNKEKERSIEAEKRKKGEKD